MKSAEGKMPVSINASTKIHVLILGILAGSGGVIHGIYEILEGNKPPIDIMPRIGAFTVIPDYLVTGICAVLVGISVIVWSITRIHKKWGPTVYLSLSMILAVVGGGVAMIPGSILAWAVATRIRKPLLWWKKAFAEQTRKVLSNLWLATLVIGFVLFVAGFSIWSLVLPPGEIREVTAMHRVCWSFLVSGALFLIVAIICGFARDIERGMREDRITTIAADVS